MTRMLWLVGLAAVAPRFAAAQVAQETRGAADRFGPGFTALSDERVEFQLKERAHAALLWVTPRGGITLFYPQRSRDRSERRAGRHAINVSDVPSPIQSTELAGAPIGTQPGQIAPTGARILMGRATESAQDPAVSGYWVLVVTETPMLAAEMWRRLEPLSRAVAGPAVLDEIGAVLAPDPATAAMYVAAVAVRR